MAFIVVLATTAGQVCERFDTYDEAKRRVETYPAKALTGLPLLFEELADGSQRLVREDGKPLQWHRLPELEDLFTSTDAPLPLSDETLSNTEIVAEEIPLLAPDEFSGEDEPL